jgi:hypothetical protein
MQDASLIKKIVHAFSMHCVIALASVSKTSMHFKTKGDGVKYSLGIQFLRDTVGKLACRYILDYGTFLYLFIIIFFVKFVMFLKLTRSG